MRGSDAAAEGGEGRHAGLGGALAAGLQSTLGQLEEPWVRARSKLCALLAIGTSVPLLPYLAVSVYAQFTCGVGIAMLCETL